MSEDPSQSGDGSDSVAQVFLAWLEEREHGRSGTFEELCARHEGERERLVALRALHERAAAALTASAGGALDGAPPPPPGGAPATRYETRGEIARGGMGAVLEVFDPSLRRTIAMKVVRTDADFRAGETREEEQRNQSRLLAEAQILAQLDHPGVVSIHELGQDASGRVYFTMKRVQGHDFGVVIRAHHSGDPQWRLPRAIGVLVRVCEALAYAHGKGVIHRDLKPANVMVGRFGEAFVMDWGLARVDGRPIAPPVPLAAPALGPPLDGATAPAEPRPPSAAGAPDAPSLVHTDRESSRLDSSSAIQTLAGSAVGTPGYMAPEQARADGAAIGPRADVYALGAMLYHLLAGQHPYARERKLSSSELLRATLAGPPEPLARLARRAPEELVAIADKAMAREPAERYASMLELAGDLNAWLEGRVVRAHRTGAWAELSKWVGRNRGAAAAVLAVVLGLALAAGVQAISARELLLAQRDTAQRSEELRREDSLSRVALAAAALPSGEIGHARELLAGCPEDLRGFEWRHLWRESDTSARGLEFPGLDVKTAFVLPGGRELLVAGAAAPHRVVIADLASGATLREIPLAPARAINAATLSADGRRLAVFAHLGELMLWDARDWSAEATLDSRLHGWHGASFAPRGALLAAYGTEGVELWDAERRERLGLLCAGQADVADVAWSPDGERLFAASWDGSVSAWDVATRALVRVLRDGEERMQQVECSPDGRWLAGGDWDSRLYVWDAQTLELVQRSDRVGGQVMALAWSPDSRTVAVGGGALVRLFEVCTEACTWRRVGRLAGDAGRVNSLSFTADGATLVGGSSLGAVRLWDLSSGAGRTLLREDGREPAGGVALGPGGALAAVGWSHGALELWDTERRERVRAFATGARIRHVDWSRDGARIAVADWESGVRLLDPGDGRELARLEVAQPTEAHFDPAGRRLAAAAEDGRLRVWDLASGELLWAQGTPPRASGWPGALFGASWSEDGSELVACDHDGEVEVRDAASGALSRSTRRPGMLFAQFAPGGRILVSAYAGNRGMEMLDARTLETVWRSAHTSHLWPVVAPVGERIFTANWSGFLGAWDARTGRLVTELEGLPPGNPRVGVSADGRRVVMAVGKYVAVFDGR